MFNAVMEEASIFRKVIDSIKDIVNQVNLEANESGLFIQAMDSAHVSLVSLTLNEGGFKEYRCDKPIALGINLTDLSKVLKMANNDDKLTLKADSNTSYLTIIFENSKTGKEFEIQLNLLSLESENLGIPDTEYPTSINMSSSEFFKLCKEITSVAEVVNIEMTDNKKVLFSYSGKSGKGKLTLRQTTSDSDQDSVVLKCEESVNCKYGLQYLNIFSKASTLADKVEISLSSSFPMMIHLVIEDKGSIKFYLAPKMEEDEQ